MGIDLDLGFVPQSRRACHDSDLASVELTVKRCSRFCTYHSLMMSSISTAHLEVWQCLEERQLHCSGVPISQYVDDDERNAWGVPPRVAERCSQHLAILLS